MAGTFVSDTIQNGAGATVPTTTVINGSAKAWVVFDGTGTVAIRASYNVSSVTDLGTGQYDVNFTTAMSNANYSSVATDNYYGITNAGEPAPSSTASKVRVYTYNTGGSFIDASGVSVAIFST
jgi:hypothetical protein